MADLSLRACGKKLFWRAVLCRLCPGREGLRNDFPVCFLNGCQNEIQWYWNYEPYCFDFDRKCFNLSICYKASRNKTTSCVFGHFLLHRQSQWICVRWLDEDCKSSGTGLLLMPDDDQCCCIQVVKDRRVFFTLSHFGICCKVREHVNMLNLTRFWIVSQCGFSHTHMHTHTHTHTHFSQGAKHQGQVHFPTQSPHLLPISGLRTDVKGNKGE